MAPMKRPRQHVLEDESRLTLKNFLPSEWIVEDIRRDYGLDMQITIVDEEKVTNTVFCVQIKATDRTPRADRRHLRRIEKRDGGD